MRSLPEAWGRPDARILQDLWQNATQKEMGGPDIQRPNRPIQTSEAVATAYRRLAFVGVAGCGADEDAAGACLPFSFTVSIGASRSCCNSPLPDTNWAAKTV